MVSAPVADALLNPAHALAALFDPRSPLTAFPAAVAAHFAALFGPPAAFANIPALNVLHPPQLFPKNALVAFRALVQDTSPSPSIYLAKSPANEPGGWGLPVPDLEQPDPAHLAQCTVLWATSVPGESLWCTHRATGLYQENNLGLSPTPTRPHKFPLPATPHIGVQVKIYDSSLADTLKPSDLTTFVGILTKEPFYSQDFESSVETDVVPTLHVLFTRPTPPTIIPRAFPVSHPPSELKIIRDRLLTWIADEGLGGDKHAAEWVLLSAIARTHSRTPPVYPPSLTLSSFPTPSDASANPTLSHILSLLLPITCTLPLSLDIINKTSFFPESKNEDLHSGWLQVPKGTHYLLTESGITEGSVLNKGLENLRAVQDMMIGQTLDYVFPFSRFTFPTDVSFLVLAQGKKSAFFQTSNNATLNPRSDINFDLFKPLDKIMLPGDEVLEQWRDFIGGSKVGTVTVEDETAHYIQEDFVNERKAAQEKGSAMTSDDLIHLMITARLLALSYHESLVTREIWEKTKFLDAERRSRI